MGQLKEIKFEDKKFDANGKTYFIEQSVSYARWMEWRKIQPQLGFDCDYGTMFAQLRKAYDFLNQREQKPLDAGNILFNLMNGIKGAMDDKHIPLVMRLCALFMNTADEDRTVITEQMIMDKVDDWNKEGIGMQSFFLFAISSIPNFLPNYESIIRDISQGKGMTGEGAGVIK